MTNHLDSPWTPKMRQELREHWAAGLSVTQIGKRMGITRGSVSGQVRLMKLPKRSAERQPTDGRTHKVKQRSVAVVDQAPKQAEPLLKTLLDLKHDECRWPLGDGPFVFCAMPQASGGPYCACHAREAYQPNPWHRKAA